jgi:hypothetical protein
MAYQKKVLPSARDEFTRFSQTYGAEFAAAARKWRDSIVNAAAAGTEHRLTEVSVEELLERMLNQNEQDGYPALDRGAWEHALLRFREASWRERALAALAFLRSLSPPWEQKVSRSTFSALGISDMLEMFAYYEVNRAEKCVVFTKFEVWTAR